MLSVEEAISHITAMCRQTPTETIALHAAAGRILRENYPAPIDIPPFANSSMDGYAVQSNDIATASDTNPIILRVIGEQPAGHSISTQITQGTAVRIFTGAPIPSGADAVIQQELTTPDTGTNTVTIHSAMRQGTNIRPAGSDTPRDTPLAPAGAKLSFAHLAALSSAGIGAVKVARQPRIAIVATGNELTNVGDALEPGHIYNSNGIMLATMAQENGAIPIVLPTARDTVADIQDRFQQAQETDLILTTGGVSVGEYDLVRHELERMGQVTFWQVNVRPGKPLLFGMVGTTPIVGLPGNPVSSAVTFLLFVVPALRALLGQVPVQPPLITVQLGEKIPQGERRHYVRAQIRYEDGIAVGYPTGDQGSHRIASLQDAMALIIIPEGNTTLPGGTVVQALLL